MQNMYGNNQGDADDFSVQEMSVDEKGLRFEFQEREQELKESSGVNQETVLDSGQVERSEEEKKIREENIDFLSQSDVEGGEASSEPGVMEVLEDILSNNAELDYQRNQYDARIQELTEKESGYDAQKDFSKWIWSYDEKTYMDGDLILGDMYANDTSQGRSSYSSIYNLDDSIVHSKVEIYEDELGYSYSSQIVESSSQNESKWMSEFSDNTGAKGYSTGHFYYEGDILTGSSYDVYSYGSYYYSSATTYYGDSSGGYVSSLYQDSYGSGHSYIFQNNVLGIHSYYSEYFGEGYSYISYIHYDGSVYYNMFSYTVDGVTYTEEYSYNDDQLYVGGQFEENTFLTITTGDFGDNLIDLSSESVGYHVKAGPGDDIITLSDNPNISDNMIVGGLGQDVIHLSKTSGSRDIIVFSIEDDFADTIINFVPGEDKLVFDPGIVSSGGSTIGDLMSSFTVDSYNVGYDLDNSTVYYGDANVVSSDAILNAVDANIAAATRDPSTHYFVYLSEANSTSGVLYFDGNDDGNYTSDEIIAYMTLPDASSELTVGDLWISGTSKVSFVSPNVNQSVEGGELNMGPLDPL